jgi:hypothetical protein
MSDGSNKVWVSKLNSSYGYGTPTQYYGPSSEPIEIPKGLADGLGLEPVDAPEPKEAPTTDGDGAGELEAAKKTLEADLATAKTALASKEAEQPRRPLSRKRRPKP